MRDTAELIYNIFKYHLVKYLGVFDIAYRLVRAKKEHSDPNEILGMSILLHKLEHNAFTQNGRKVSDYGVPFKLIEYYDSLDKSIAFDDYEEYINNKLSAILSPQ